MNYEDRTRDILDKVKRLKAKQKKRLAELSACVLCLVAAAVITSILILSPSHSLPVSEDISAAEQSESGPEDNSSESIIFDDSAAAEQSSGEESAEDSSAYSAETSEPSPSEEGFAGSRDSLIEKSEDFDFGVPELLDDSTYGDALKNALGAFAGRVKYFGGTLDDSNSQTLITVYAEVTEAYSEGYAGVVEFKCPYYYLKLFSEDTVYLFFVFDYSSNKASYGSDYFAVLKVDGFSSLVKNRELSGAVLDVKTISAVKAYFSESYRLASAFRVCVNSAKAPYTVSLKGEGYEMVIARDENGMMVSVTADGKERKFFRKTGDRTVYEADFNNMKLVETDGFSYASGLTGALGLFVNGDDIDFVFDENTLEKQYASGIYEFTDGVNAYTACFDFSGVTAGITVNGSFTAMTGFAAETEEGITSSEGFVNFEASLEEVLSYFGTDDVKIPENLNLTADYDYCDNRAVFTGNVLSYGSGSMNGQTPESVIIKIKPGEIIYNVSFDTLEIPAYFTGRLNPEKEYLFVLEDGKFMNPSDLLEIGEDGTLYSPLGTGYDGGSIGMTNINDFRTYYSESYIAARRIKDTFTGLGKLSDETEKFEISYVPVDMTSREPETGTEVLITYNGSTVEIRISPYNESPISYYRDFGNAEIYRLDEGGEKIISDSSEYNEKSMLIIYIVSIKTLSEAEGFLEGGNSVSYATPVGNKLTFGMDSGELKTISLNGYLLAEVNYLNYG